MPLPESLLPWEPQGDDRWDRRKAAHLYRRAGFGPTIAEIDEGVDLGMEPLVSRLIGYPDGPSRLDDMLDLVRTELVDFDENLGTPQSFWLYRMIATDRPFAERLTLFWHGHFATANFKVQSPSLMYRQYETMRDRGRGRFDDLLLAIAQDPAMILWLDNNTNRRRAPNENFARELLELFTMGPGAYTEADIQAAARAFTGWHTENGQFIRRDGDHDPGDKTFLGQTGPWDGTDIIRIVAERRETARFLAGKLLRHFVMEQPPEEAIAGLAEVYLGEDHRLRAMLDVLFRSRLFYRPAAYRALVRDPVHLVVGTVRLLDANSNREMALPAMAQMGQELFNPPNVKGWEGGEAWINSVTLLARSNFVNDLLMRSPVRVPGRDHLLLQALKEKGLREPEAVVGFLADAVIQADLEPGQRTILLDYYANELRKLDDGGESWDFKLRRLAYMIMTLPAYQLS